MSDASPDFYDLLEIDRDASQEEVRKAFREQVRRYHPDHNDDPRARAQFTALKKAYDTLGDAETREEYDRMGHEEYVRKRIEGLPSPEKWQTGDLQDGERTTHERVARKASAADGSGVGSRLNMRDPGIASDRGLVYTLVSYLVFGWPPLFGASILYLFGLSLFAGRYAEGVGRLVGRLTAAGLDPGALASVLTGSRYGIATVPQHLAATGVTTGRPSVSGLVFVAGLVVLPLLFGLNVHQTRQSPRMHWDPSYLYVAGAVAPLVAVAAAYALGPPAIGVDLVGLVAAPVGALLLMPFSAFVRPRLVTALRELR